VVKNTTQTIPFYPEGAGWTANQVEITKKAKVKSEEQK
jgi:hypothetical protein